MTTDLSLDALEREKARTAAIPHSTITGMDNYRDGRVDGLDWAIRSILADQNERAAKSPEPRPLGEEVAGLVAEARVGETYAENAIDAALFGRLANALSTLSAERDAMEGALSRKWLIDVIRNCTFAPDAADLILGKLAALQHKGESDDLDL